MRKMKKWSGGILAASLFMLLTLRYGILRNTTGRVSLPNTPLLFTPTTPPLPSSESANQVIAAETLASSLFLQWNISNEVQKSLLTWNHMTNLENYSQSLPLLIEAIREGRVAWKNLVEYRAKIKHGDENNSSVHKLKQKHCPLFLSKMNATEFVYGFGGHRLEIPCGLIQGSAITIVGIPNGGFQLDLMGETLARERGPPVILHYNVRLRGDKMTEDPVIVQNTWTAAHGWGEEVRCPSTPTGNMKGTPVCSFDFFRSSFGCTICIPLGEPCFGFVTSIISLPFA